MIFLRLYLEFFHAGLFAVGGGLATVPFLREMGAATGWFTDADLTTMLAVSESTPGPIGVNMATYVGFQTAGIPGALAATIGLTTPSVIIILIIAGFLQRFRQSRTVDAVFRGLRPASTALISAVGISVAANILLFHESVDPVTQAVSVQTFYWPSILLALAVFLCMQNRHLKKLHPIVFIGLSALAGIVLRL